MNNKRSRMVRIQKYYILSVFIFSSFFVLLLMLEILWQINYLSSLLFSDFKIITTNVISNSSKFCIG